MHDVLIQEFGGAAGLRDEAALTSVLMRSQLGYYDTLVQEAAALMESLANNHAFVDGNKRVAFFVTDTYLRMNGHFVDCDNNEAHSFFMHLFDTGTFRFAQLEQWIEEKAQPLLTFS